MSPEKLGGSCRPSRKSASATTPSRRATSSGAVYEYFIKEFARSEGHRGGEFYTPATSVRAARRDAGALPGPHLRPGVRLMRHVHPVGEVHRRARRPARRARDLRPGDEPGDVAHRPDEPRDPRACRRTSHLATACSTISTRHSRPTSSSLTRRSTRRSGAPSRVKDDVRWKCGLPPDGNANYAWIQHFASHLAPDGRAGFVLANGSLTSSQSGEGTIRENAHPRRSRRLHRRAAWAALLHDRDPGLPVVPRSQQGLRWRA